MQHVRMDLRGELVSLARWTVVGAAGGALTMLLIDPRTPGRATRAPTAAGGPLAPLADSIAADLDSVMARELYVPREKALLSRAGGRCEDDGTQLEFDPYVAGRTPLPTLRRASTPASTHYRWWIYWYQLWLAERGVNAALLHLLRGEARHGAFARELALRVLRDVRRISESRQRARADPSFL